MAEEGVKDYVKIAIDYAKEASDLKNRKSFGVWIRFAAIRFLNDLKKAEKGTTPFYFDEWHGNDVCDFAEKLPHVEGVWDTPNIVLHRSHVFFLVQLFGFRNRKTGTRRFTTALFAISRKNAKALALNTPIPTPAGWSTMGDLQEGDQVFGANGEICNVVATSPIFENHECYELTFSNGEKVVADAGHLWLTNERDKKESSVKTTEEIFRTRFRKCSKIENNHSLSMPKAISDIEDKILDIPPYTLGAWLGDGNSYDARITNHIKDYEIIQNIMDEGVSIGTTIRENSKNTFRYTLSDGDKSQLARDLSLQSKLRNNGLLNNKHIPLEYLRASYEQRLRLLQGLMDTDGTINKNGTVISITTIIKSLADSIGELLSTFGIKYSIKQNPSFCNGVRVKNDHYKIQFTSFRDLNPVFRLKRKLERMRVTDGTNTGILACSRTCQIVDIRKVHSVPTKCISVDSVDNLFLFGKTMLPTHNSTLASIIGLYCQNCEGEIGPQVVTGATTGQQARIVFNVAKRMVEKTSELREAFMLEPFANAIASYHNGGTYKPINAKASTQDGLNPSCTILDEIHAHPNHDLLNVLKSAAGARKNPLFLYLTTEGYSNPGPWQEEREFAKKVLRGIIEADHYLAIYYCVDEKDDELGTEADDDFDESAWIKANPLMEVNPLLLDEIRKSAIEAKDKPGQHAEFKIKRLNRPSSVSHGFINLTKWRECRGAVDLEFLKNYPCYGGLDLSSTTDLTSFRLKWDVNGVMYTYGWRWVPFMAVRKRKQRGLIPYQGWVDKGLLLEAGNEAVDYSAIEKKIIEVNENFNLQGIAYDGWNAAQTVQRLSDANINMVQFIQGPKSYHPAMQALEVAYLSNKFIHGDDPILNWNASNLVARADANLNNAPDKKRSTEKIDDMCALLMGIGLSIKTDLEPKTEHQLFFI